MEVLGDVGTWIPSFGVEAVELRSGRDAWSVVEYVCHLRDALGFYRMRIEAIALSSEPPQLTPWDPDLAAVVGHYSNSDPIAAHEEAVQAGADLRSRLQAMTGEAITKVGIGTDGGTRSLQALAARAAHEVVHHSLDLGRAGLARRLNSEKDTTAPPMTRWSGATSIGLEGARPEPDG